MILRYTIRDGLGNHLMLVIQAPSRAEADKIMRSQAAHGYGRAGIKTYNFDPFDDVVVTDLTNEPVIHKELFDHELGELL